MKYLVTKKEIQFSYSRKIAIGAERLQKLIVYLKCDAYTQGVYGWNADIFELDYKTVLVAGYRPFGNCWIDRREEEEIIKDFEKLEAENKNINDFDLRFEKNREDAKSCILKIINKKYEK